MFGPIEQLSHLFIAVITAGACFAGWLLTSRRLRKTLFGPMLFLAFVPAAYAQTTVFYYPQGYTLSWNAWAAENGFD